MAHLENKRILSIMLTLTMILSLLPTNALAATWAKDLDGHWAESAIKTRHSYGIMSGDGNGYYKPNEDITRAEFSSMVNRAFVMTRLLFRSFPARRRRQPTRTYRQKYGTRPT